jgi:hypothetical protein
VKEVVSVSGVGGYEAAARLGGCMRPTGVYEEYVSVVLLLVGVVVVVVVVLRLVVAAEMVSWTAVEARRGPCVCRLGFRTLPWSSMREWLASYADGCVEHSRPFWEAVIANDRFQHFRGAMVGSNSPECKAELLLLFKLEGDISCWGSIRHTRFSLGVGYWVYD